MANKTVLVTGCSTGFGKLAAKTFHDKGWNVIATMRTPEKETELTKLENVLVTKLDVTDQKSIDEALRKGLDKFGSLDVLVNNAGYGGHAIFEQFSEETIKAMYETNVFGLMRVSRAVLPHMRKQKSGSIINVTSVAGVIGAPTVSVYSSTKFAVEGLSESMAYEYKPFNIKVKTVAPGAFETSFSANCDNKDVAQGDQELNENFKVLMEQIQTLIHSNALRPQGAAPADPQEVADKIYHCATEETPIHNPVGADAEMITELKNSLDKQEFVEKMFSMMVPA